MSASPPAPQDVDRTKPRFTWQDKDKAMAEMWAMRAAGIKAARRIRVTRRTRSR